MSADEFRCLSLALESGIATLCIDHPPVNLLDAALIGELDRAGRLLGGDPEVRVVLLESADPDFFVAHADVGLILAVPPRQPPPEEPNFFQRVVDRFRSMPKPTIAKVEGVCRGGGSELALSCDMRFAARGRAVFGQPELAVGILPGGSGTQRLPRLMGRGRALEAVLGAGDFSAEEAERYGWVNRALAADEIGPFVAALAARVASFPPAAVARAKAAVDAAFALPLEAGLAREARLFEECLALPEARRRMQAFLAAGGQTREVELGGFG